MSRQGSSRRGAPALVFALALALTAGSGARAEAPVSRTPAQAEPGSAETQPPDQPTGSAPVPQDAPEFVLPEQVVRVPRTEASVDRTASATVVTAEQFAGEVKGVAEIVATAPGVAIQDYGGLGHVATASIRGSTAQGVLVLLDGLPLNTAAGGGVDLSSIPRQWISRIEVVRGTEGAHYGAGALGGVLDITTRPAAAGSWSAEASAGSFETYSAAADGAIAAGPWTVLAAGSAEGTSGRFQFLYDDGRELTPEVRSDNAARRGGLLLKAGRPMEGGRLDLAADLSAGQRDLPGPVGDLSASGWEDDARAVGSARLVFPGPWEGVALSTRLHARTDRLDLWRAPAPETRQRGGEAGLDIAADVARGTGTLRLEAGASGEVLSNTALGSRRTRAALFGAASDDLDLGSGALRLSPAIRIDSVGPFAGFSGKLGTAARLRGGFVLRASAGRSFRPPSFAELYLYQPLVVPNPDLRPEEGLGADSSIAWEGPLGFASAGAFATLYRDLIYYDLASFQTFKPHNAGRALARGLEAEAASARVPRLLGLSGSASYTLLDTETLLGPANVLGKELPHRARHRAYARASVAPGPFEAHLEAHYTSAQYADARNLSRIPAVLAWNAGGSVRLARAPAVRLHVEVKNLADDRTLQDPFENPLPGRMVMVTLRAGAHDTDETP